MPKRPLSTLPMDARAAAFKAVYRKLKEDPILNSVVEKWSHVPTHIPTAADLPYVRVWAAPGTIAVGSPSRHNAEIIISFDYAINAAGMSEEDAWMHSINFYGQVEKAINPFSEPEWLVSAIQKAEPGAVYRGLRIEKQGFGTSFVPDLNAIKGECRIAIELKLPACRPTPTPPE